MMGGLMLWPCLAAYRIFIGKMVIKLKRGVNFVTLFNLKIHRSNNLDGLKL
jgi:hypothetical protein